MVKVLRNPKTGQFAGSIGSGKTRPPKPLIPVLPNRTQAAERMFQKHTVYNPATPWIDPKTDPMILVSSNSWEQKTFFQAFLERGSTPMRTHFIYRNVRNIRSTSRMRNIALEVLEETSSAVKAGRDEEPVVTAKMWGLLHNRNITDGALRVLGFSRDPYLRIIVAMHDKSSQELVESLIEDPVVAERAAVWGNLSQETQSILANSDSPETLTKLASNPYVDEKFRVMAALNNHKA